MDKSHRRLWRAPPLAVRPLRADASRTEKLQFVRAYNVRSAVGCALLLILALLVGAASWVIALAVIALIVVLLDNAWISWKLRRERRTII